MSKLRSKISLLQRLEWRIEAGAALALATFLIALVPLRLWAGSLGNLGSFPQSDNEPSPEQFCQARLVSRSVRATACLVPFRAACLPQAMAARWMMARRGIPSRIVLGLHAADENDREFHAWVMCGDQCVLGGGGLEKFSTFKRQRRGGRPS